MHTSALSERNSKGRLGMCMKPFVKIASDTYSKNAIEIRNEVKQDYNGIVVILVLFVIRNLFVSHLTPTER